MKCWLCFYLSWCIKNCTDSGKWNGWMDTHSDHQKAKNRGEPLKVSTPMQPTVRLPAEADGPAPNRPLQFPWCPTLTVSQKQTSDPLQLAPADWQCFTANYTIFKYFTSKRVTWMLIAYISKNFAICTFTYSTATLNLSSLEKGGRVLAWGFLGPLHRF